MGALHEGHLSLVELASRLADRVVVSVFVNPTQFGEGEDFEEYPRDLERDSGLLSNLGVDALFVPEAGDIYPEGYSTWVIETSVSSEWEGASRPDHFRGVATVVTKLLLIVEPDALVLGQKDAQQVAVLRRVMEELHFGVELVVGPTVRESDGLALSSRNAYLSKDERKQAVCLREALCEARRLFLEGEVDPTVITGAMRDRVEREPAASVDYVAALDPLNFKGVDELGSAVLFCLAVFIGKIRLIDNELVEREG
jgi:pantoate--beta-alanine ligase